MAAPAVALSDAIVADLNDSGRSWSQYFKAERVYVPLWIGRVELADLQCLVAPFPVVESEAFPRSASVEHYSIDFGFAKRLDKKTPSEIDDLLVLVDSVATRYKVTGFTVANLGRFVPLRRTDEYVTHDPSRLTPSKQGSEQRYSGDFLSVFRIPYRFMEAAS